MTTMKMIKMKETTTQFLVAVVVVFSMMTFVSANKSKRLRDFTNEVWDGKYIERSRDSTSAVRTR